MNWPAKPVMEILILSAARTGALRVKNDQHHEKTSFHNVTANRV